MNESRIADALERIADCMEQEEARSKRREQVEVDATRIHERMAAAVEESNQRARRDEVRHHPDLVKSGPTQ